MIPRPPAGSPGKTECSLGPRTSNPAKPSNVGMGNTRSLKSGSMRMVLNRAIWAYLFFLLGIQVYLKTLVGCTYCALQEASSQNSVSSWHFSSVFSRLLQPHQAGGVWVRGSVDPMVMAHLHNSSLVKFVPLSNTMWDLVLVGQTL